MTKAAGAKAPKDTPRGSLRPPWKPGQSGNPKGRPEGSRNKATVAALELLDGEAEKLTRKCVELALSGDTTALRLYLERIAPPRKDAPGPFTLPQMESARDALAGVNALMQAVANGALTPGEASSMAGLIEAFRKTAKFEDLERRVNALEEGR